MSNDPEIKVVIRTPTSTRSEEKEEEPTLTITFTLETYGDDLSNVFSLSGNNDIYSQLFSGTRKLALTKFKNAQNVAEECVICKKNYTLNEDLCINSCLHKFHYDCLEQWIRVKPTCPMCRTVVPTTV